ncbi:hypothetical protein HUJ05_001044 [Dendroctonus ponderosae]|nr:hypothetical protein HUJ05_001044 [Dendroctonus ponderosae]
MKVCEDTGCHYLCYRGGLERNKVTCGGGPLICDKDFKQFENITKVHKLLVDCLLLTDWPPHISLVVIVSKRTYDLLAHQFMGIGDSRISPADVSPALSAVKKVKVQVKNTVDLRSQHQNFVVFVSYLFAIEGNSLAMLDIYCKYAPRKLSSQNPHTLTMSVTSSLEKVIQNEFIVDEIQNKKLL